MITVKKNAIRYKDSDGTMKDSGVLCQVGVVNPVDSDGYTILDYKYASTVTHTYESGNLPSDLKVLLSRTTGTTNLFFNCVGLKNVKIIHDGVTKPTSMKRTFYAPNQNYTEIRKIILKIDTSTVTDFTQAFCHLKNSESVEIIGELDFSSATSVNTLFQASTGLKEVRLKKETLKISISINSCSLLSDASIQSIIDGLADLTGQTAQTLTLHADVKAKLTEEQIATITSKNWTLA